MFAKIKPNLLSYFRGILQPASTSLSIGNNGASVVLSSLQYNEQDLPAVKLLGQSSNAGFLQKVDYYYDVAGKLIRINDPLSTACTVDELCDLQLNIYKSRLDICDDSGLSLDCSFVNGMYIEQVFYPFNQSYDINVDFESMLDAIEVQVDYLGFYFTEVIGTVTELDNYTTQYQIKILGSDIDHVRLSYSDCLVKPEFDKINCTGINPNESDPALVANKDLFLEMISYDGLNISRIETDGFCQANKVRNDYIYDDLHRLLNTNNTLFNPERIEGRYNTTHSYDAVGNITSLQRWGYLGASDYGQIDRMTYNYSTNSEGEFELNDIGEGANIDFGFGASTQFDYDQNGNLTEDFAKGITDIDYSPMNLPVMIHKEGGDIQFQYTYSGEQIKKIGENGERQYLGGIEIQEDVAQFVSHPEGRYNLLNDVHEYQIKDHLGNVVVHFSDVNDDGLITHDGIATNEDHSEVLQRNFYYAFGMQQEGWMESEVNTTPRISLDPDNAYLYNGKELHNDGGLGWSNYGARFYDAAIGRWGQIDPMSERRFWVSGYNYCQNNTISRIDPDGRFDTKFSAIWHKWFHGGGQVVKTEDGWAVIQNKRTEVFEDGSHYEDYDLVKSRPQVAHAKSFSFGFAWGGGLGIELGLVFDDLGNVAPFGAFDKNFGFSVYAGFNNKTITSIASDGIFRNSQWEGDDVSWDISIGPLGFGGGKDLEDRKDMFWPSEENSGKLYKFSSITPSLNLKEWIEWKKVPKQFLFNSGKVSIQFQRSTGYTRLFDR